MISKGLHIILFLLLSGNLLKAQILFHQDIFYGGVTAGGVSTGVGGMLPGDIVSLPLYIEPSSIVRKAYLFTYEVGYPPFSQTIYINGTGFTFDSSSNKIMTSIHANINFTPVKLYYKDITNYLNNNLTDTFNIYFPYTTIPNPPPNSPGWGWYTAFLYIEYENSTLPKVASTIWLNDKDFDYVLSSTPFNMNGMNPVDNNYPVGLSLFTDRTTHANKVKVVFNGNLLGKISYSDSINWQWNHAGVKGHFYYQNNTLYGLDDDTANSTMNNSDGLADVSSFLLNGSTSYSIKLEQEFLPPHPNASNGGYKNVNLLFLNPYTTHCDTFSTSIISDTVICKGDSIQLYASGGTNYYWQPITGLSNPNVANPIASPSTSTLYVVRIETDSGCSKTEKVLVKVNEPPSINSVNITPSVCGNNDGQISIAASGINPLQYSIGNGFQNSNTFANLASGNYNITVLDNNGCPYDTIVFVPQINPVNSFFTANPQSGTEPLFVAFNNQSAGANNYLWLIDNDFLSTNSNESYIFDSSGVYTVTLIAYNNTPQCADTFSLQIIVYDSLMVQIPNVFTPNDDGINDNFTIKVEGAKKIKGAFINRWENIMHEFNIDITSSPATVNVWDGYSQTGQKVSDGVYYYIIELTDMQGETKSINGFLHIFK